MKQRSVPLVGLALGVVLLALMAAFAIGLPKAVGSGDEEGEGAAAEPVSLPDELAGGFVAERDPDVPAPQGADPATYADTRAKLEDSATTLMSDLYDADVAVKGYRTVDGSKSISITVADVPAGLFEPLGPPVAPEIFELERSNYELKTVDGAICAVSWTNPLPAGQAVDPAEVPASVNCQLGDDDRAYQIFGVGLTAVEAVTVLREVA